MEDFRDVFLDLVLGTDKMRGSGTKIHGTGP